jgi:hypothetical protein
MEWISVDERLPEYYEEVIAWIGKEMAFAYRLKSGAWRIVDVGFCSPKDVTHWQPLPAPPETGQNQAEGVVND